ncbi:Cation/H(+) antiporter 19 [Acorus calamus]|uniref:Cation/H(+) antiporter 19 n=1 Tax=Acorus calamus TaxID=4465 RepID=A0AAV9D0M3_ACOCL|nr:Cation/H(+) antiporter 19 [Acorus calamus]
MLPSSSSWASPSPSPPSPSSPASSPSSSSSPRTSAASPCPPPPSTMSPPGSSSPLPLPSPGPTANPPSSLMGPPHRLRLRHPRRRRAPSRARVDGASIPGRRARKRSLHLRHLTAVLAAGFVTAVLAGVLIEKIEDLISGLFLPLYFVSSGLKTDVTTIRGARSWGLLALVITNACLGKIGGTVAVSLLAKIPFREAVALGFLMNTKGLVELIVLNIGKDRKVLNGEEEGGV